MKVLHVIETLGRGGAEQLLVTLLPELARQGCQPEVAVRNGPYDLQPELEARGIPVHHLPTTRKWNLLAGAQSIARLAQRTGAQVVHAHLYFPAVSVAMMHLLRLHPARTFVTFHNLAYAGANKSGLGLWFKKRLAALLYPRGFDRMFGVSNAVADHYSQTLGLKNVVVLHNPVTVVEQTLPHSASVGSPQLVVPGRLVPEKGHQYLIQALTFLKTPVSVTFAGGGSLLDKLQESNPGIRITGSLPHDQMLREIALADLVVIPSRFEGFGLIALEAMALGRPVVATRAGGLPEVLGDAGMIVPVGDPKALADAIQTVLGDPAMAASMGQAGRDRAISQFSVQVIAGRLLSQYQLNVKKGAA